MATSKFTWDIQYIRHYKDTHHPPASKFTVYMGQLKMKKGTPYKEKSKVVLSITQCTVHVHRALGFGSLKAPILFQIIKDLLEQFSCILFEDAYM